MTDSTRPADLILRHGTIYTLNPAAPWAQSIAFRDGSIAAVGEDSDVRRLAGASTAVVELGGTFVMPGIVDVHNHHSLGGWGELFECKFPPTASLDEILAAVAAYAATLAPDEWVVGGIWSSDLLSTLATSGSRSALDRACGGRPAVLRDDSHHNRWLNTAALERIGVTAATPDPPNGEIVRDPASGEAVGMLLENASILAERLVAASATPEKYAAAARRALATLNECGVTGFQDACTSIPMLEALNALDTSGEISAWAVASLPAFNSVIETAIVGDELIARRESFRTPHVRPDFVKIFLDGVPTTARTAAFLEPYLPTEARGCCYRGDIKLTFPELVRWIAKSERLGLSVKVHCTGDASVRMTLDAVEVVRGFDDEGAVAPLHHIAHASYIDSADLPRFKALGVVADLSPIIWFPSVILDSITEALGEERARRFWPMRSLAEAGALLAAGSDWPVVPDPDPWRGIEGMVTRRDPGGRYDDALWPEQALDLATVLEIYTRNAARAMRLGDVMGSLETGKSGDAIVLDRNPFEIPANTLSQTKVVTTYFEGRAVHRRA